MAYNGRGYGSRSDGRDYDSRSNGRGYDSRGYGSRDYDNRRGYGSREYDNRRGYDSRYDSRDSRYDSRHDSRSEVNREYYDSRADGYTSGGFNGRYDSRAGCGQRSGGVQRASAAPARGDRRAHARWRCTASSAKQQRAQSASIAATYDWRGEVDGCDHARASSLSLLIHSSPTRLGVSGMRGQRVFQQVQLLQVWGTEARRGGRPRCIRRSAIWRSARSQRWRTTRRARRQLRALHRQDEPFWG